MIGRKDDAGSEVSMNQCDFCGEQCNTTYTYQDDAGNYFIGHKRCMNRLERMDAESKSTRRGAGG